MLLRYIVLHGQPKTEEDWKKFQKWKEEQLGLAECQMANPEGIAKKCEGCPGLPGCPKSGRRRG